METLLCIIAVNLFCAAVVFGGEIVHTNRYNKNLETMVKQYNETHEATKLEIYEA